MKPKRKAALLIVAHGSTVNPDSSAPTLAHAAEIRRRRIFADVGCAFWKEEPRITQISRILAWEFSETDQQRYWLSNEGANFVCKTKSRHAVKRDG